METTLSFSTTARFASAQSTLLDFVSLIMDDQLTGIAKRVLAYLSDRAIRHRTSSEAVPVADIASALRVHRNAVSLAFNQLESAGLVKRIAVKHRGAPTRTKLVGRAAKFAASFAHIVGFGSDPAGPADPEWLVKLPDDEVGTSTGPAQVIAPHAKAAEVAEGEGDVREAAENASVPLPSIQKAAPDIATPPQEAVVTTPVTTQKTPAPAPFKFDREVNASMIAKVPAETRLDAAQGLAASKKPDPAWQLTDAEAAHYAALFPKPEEKPKPAPRAASKPVVHVTPVVQEGLTSLITRLRRATKTEQEALLCADQIAYMVECKGLGRGDAVAGLHAGVKLVEDKRWSQPHDWSSVAHFWCGATVRALLKNTVDAHKNRR